MGNGDFEQHMKLVFSAVGAEAVAKQLRKLRADMVTPAKTANKLGLYQEELDDAERITKEQVKQNKADKKQFLQGQDRAKQINKKINYGKQLERQGINIKNIDKKSLSTIKDEVSVFKKQSQLGSDRAKEIDKKLDYNKQLKRQGFQEISIGKKSLNQMKDEAGVMKKQFKQGAERSKQIDKKLNYNKQLRREGLQSIEIGKKSLSTMKDEGAAMRARLKHTKKFKMQYMGIMFAGMQLQRVFGKLFKSLISTYKEFTKDSATPLSESLTRLEANWKYLKFAMMDASAGLLTPIIDWFGSIARAASKASPEFLEKIVMVIGSLVGVGGMSMVFGQGALLFTSMASAASHGKSLKNIEAVVTKTKNLNESKLSAGTKFFTALKKTAGIALTLYGVFNTIQDMSTGETIDFGSQLKNALTVSLGAGLFFSKSKYGGLKPGMIAGGIVMITMGLSNAGKLMSGTEAVDFGERLKAALSVGIGTALAFSAFTSAATAGIAGVIATGAVVITTYYREIKKKETRDLMKDLEMSARVQQLSFSPDMSGVTDMAAFLKNNIEDLGKIRELQEKKIHTPAQGMAAVVEDYNRLQSLWASDEGGISTEEFAIKLKELLGIQILSKEAMEDLVDEKNRLDTSFKSLIIPKLEIGPKVLTDRVKKIIEENEAAGIGTSPHIREYTYNIKWEEENNPFEGINSMLVLSNAKIEAMNTKLNVDLPTSTETLLGKEDSNTTGLNAIYNKIKDADDKMDEFNKKAATTIHKTIEIKEISVRDFSNATLDPAGIYNDDVDISQVNTNTPP